MAWKTLPIFGLEALLFFAMAGDVRFMLRHEASWQGNPPKAQVHRGMAQLPGLPSAFGCA